MVWTSHRTNNALGDCPTPDYLTFVNALRRRNRYPHFTAEDQLDLKYLKYYTAEEQLIQILNETSLSISFVLYNCIPSSCGIYQRITNILSTWRLIYIAYKQRVVFIYGKHEIAMENVARTLDNLCKARLKWCYKHMEYLCFWYFSLIQERIIKFD